MTEHLGVELIVKTSFWAAFVIDILIVGYALNISKRLGKEGFLSKVVLLVGFSALIFGIHHVLEIFLGHIPSGIAIAEGVEAVAAVVLAFSAYFLQKT